MKTKINLKPCLAAILLTFVMTTGIGVFTVHKWKAEMDVQVTAIQVKNHEQDTRIRNNGDRIYSGELTAARGAAAVESLVESTDELHKAVSRLVTIVHKMETSRDKE